MSPTAPESHTETVVIGGIPVTVERSGEGRPVLILHGGGGPGTVAGIGAHFTESSATIIPTHPGWNGTPRPEALPSIRSIADLYLAYLTERDLTDVVVIGSSLGGWIAAEMALGDTDKRIAGLVLVDAGGVLIESEPMRDFFALDARGVAEYSFHDAERFYVDPTTLPPERVAQQKGNMATMSALAGDPYMHDPTLLGRIGAVTMPVLVVWGESDRIFTPGYGAAYAAAFANARFETVDGAGHLPHLEQPAATFTQLDAFVATLA